jgi:hypothetical protein
MSAIEDAAGPPQPPSSTVAPEADAAAQKPVTIEYDDIDTDKLLAFAESTGVLKNSKPIKGNLYLLLKASGASATSRMTKPELQECLAKDLEKVVLFLNGRGAE